MRRWEVQVRQRVRLRLLERPCRPQAAPHQHLARRVVHGHGGGGVPGAEDRREDAGPRGASAARSRPRACSRASLLGRPPLEDLAYGPDQAPGASDTDELGAGGATVARRPQEAEPRVMRLRVHHRYAEHLPPAGLVAAYRRDSRGRSRAAPAAALEVGHVETD